MVSSTRTVDPLPPTVTGVLRGLAFELWLPSPPRPAATAGVVVVHGAGSCKESHHDFARAAVARGLAVVCFDQRGHGQSAGALGEGDGALADIVMFVVELRSALADRDAPIALRGSSMGGCLAILAAADPIAARAGGIDAVVAICPASTAGLARSLRAGTLGFAADPVAFGAFLDAHRVDTAVAALAVPLLIMHAEGDEIVPVAHSRELAGAMTAAGSRLIVVPGGHHRSIQHDAELQAASLRFIERSVAANRR